MKSLVAVLSIAASFFLGVSAPVRAQEISAAPTISAPAPSIAPNADPATATRAWLDTVPADKRAKSDAYFEGGYWLILWDFLLSAAISIFLLASRISARLRDFAERKTGFKAMQVVLYTIPFILLATLLAFPLTVYEHFFREHAYGLATQNFGQWFREQLIALGVNLIVTSLLLVGLYAVFRRAPRTWWIWGTIVSVIFTMLGIMLSPVYIEPLFNTYKPLNDPAISEPILAMARANEIPVTQVFEVDASRQSNRVSANVAGFLGTTRIALNDNLLKQCTLPEIREVMAHEMGHYILNHSVKLVMYFGLFFLLGFAVAKAFFRYRRAALGRSLGRSWGCRSSRSSPPLPDLCGCVFSAYAPLEYCGAGDRTRGGCVQHQYIARTGRHGEGRSEAGHLPQVRSNAAGRIHLLRSPEWSRAHPDGDGLEGGAFAVRRFGGESLNRFFLTADNADATD